MLWPVLVRPKHEGAGFLLPRELVSAAKTQCCDETAVSLDILTLQIVQEPAALTHQHEKSAPAVMIVLV